MKRYLLLATVVLVAAPLLIAGCASPSNPSPSPSVAQNVSTSTAAIATSTASPSTSSAPATSVTVTISGLSFQPSFVTVQRGTSVTWRNDDAVDHHVVSDTNAFSSPVLSSGTTYAHTFSQSGTYPYHCSIHPFMTGTITVQ